MTPLRCAGGPSKSKGSSYSDSSSARRNGVKHPETNSDGSCKKQPPDILPPGSYPKLLNDAACNGFLKHLNNADQNDLKQQPASAAAAERSYLGLLTAAPEPSCLKPLDTTGPLATDRSCLKPLDTTNGPLAPADRSCLKELDPRSCLTQQLDTSSVDRVAHSLQDFSLAVSCRSPGTRGVGKIRKKINLFFLKRA